MSETLMKTLELNSRDFGAVSKQFVVLSTNDALFAFVVDTCLFHDVRRCALRLQHKRLAQECRDRGGALHWTGISTGAFSKDLSMLSLIRYQTLLLVRNQNHRSMPSSHK